jgi:fructose-bisphosphate aldolase class II
MTEVCKERFEAFHAAGQASKIRVLRLPEMAKRYAAA